jgi:hypothetical protein
MVEGCGFPPFRQTAAKGWCTGKMDTGKMGNKLVAACMADLRTKEPDRQHSAFQSLMAATKEPVDWAYDVWDELLGLLKTGDNRQRAIAAQVLCALAKDDPKQRMLKDLAALLAVTKDERFVTARHCMQSLWKVGAAGDGQRSVLIKGLVARFKECAVEKNCTLIRYDILESLRKVYDAAKDEGIRETAAKLIELEHDLKYKKKYLALWRN